MNRRPMISVTAGILTRDDKVLIAKRPGGKHLAGYWEFPGGKNEPGETLEESLQREFSEEFGVVIKVHRFFHENVHPYTATTIKLTTYLVQWVGGEFSPVEHDEIRWVPVNELLSFQLSPADIPVAKKFVKWYSRD